MRPWDPLSERQSLLLQRIGDGDDLSGPDGVVNDARILLAHMIVLVTQGDSPAGGVNSEHLCGEDGYDGQFLLR